MTNETAWQIGRTFKIKLQDGEIGETTVDTKCVIWDCERRVFEAPCGGFVEMDWMEYLDQASLGRVELVGLPQ